MLLFYMNNEAKLVNKSNSSQSIQTKYNKSYYEKFEKKYNDFQFIEINDKIYVGAILLINDKVSEKSITQQLTNSGALIGTIAKDIVSIKIEPHKIENLLDNENILYLQVDEKIGMSLDRIKTETNFPLIHNGTYLGKEYTGEGVVVGIIDAGFDFTHSHFFRENSNVSRITRAWVQHASTSTPPIGFSYGREIIGSSLQITKFDMQNETHGTHVAGIAAGNGSFNGYKYTGIAPNSEIVMVSPIFNQNQSITTGQTNILDGIRYILSYADRVDKPAVVNMSLGTTIGPRDGTALFDRACDNLKQRGKILVTAAGNSGETKMHLSRDFTINKNPISTIANSFQTSQFGKETYVEMWGEKSNLIEFQVGIYVDGRENWKNVTYSTRTSGITSTTLTNAAGTTSYGSATITITPSEFNGKPRIFISFDDISTRANPMVRVTENSTGIIHLWNCGLGGSTGAEFNNGDTDVTLLEIGGTCKSIVSVGSYTTKNSTINLANRNQSSGFPASNGNISPFSSIGPTVDGRIKPDITAPGSLIASAFNSNSSAFSPFGNYSQYVVDRATGGFSNKDFYGVFEGTSMASPVVAGTIALMLEAYPNISFDEIMEILKETAKNDTFTGSVKDLGSPIWGFGKLNINDAVKEASMMGKVFGTFPDLNVFPNPTDSDLNINFIDSTSGNFTFVIYNQIGGVVKESKVTISAENLTSNIYFDLKDLALGSYYLIVSNEQRSKMYLIQKSF